MGYSYDEANKVLDTDNPLVDREQLLLVCKEIDDGTSEDETDAFIAAAHTTVCEHLDGWGISASVLSLIEKYLAAHYAAMTYPSVQREVLGPMSTTFALKTETGFAASRYGQTAMSLDPTGALKKLSDGLGRKDAKFSSVGSGILVTEGAY